MSTRKMVSLAILLAIALGIFFLEAQLPPIVPIPGVKLGLANIVTLVVLSHYGRREAWVVLGLRILLGAFFAGNFSVILYSGTGGLLCLIIMSLTIGLFPPKQLYVVSVFGALAHNAGQLLAAMLVMRTAGLLVYLPVLVISGIVTGAFTGLSAHYLLRALAHVRRD